MTSDPLQSQQSDPPLDLELSRGDDPRVIEEQTHEEYTDHVVPFSARLSKAPILGSWSSIASAMAFVYYGALAATLVGIEQALIGVTLTCVSYAVLGGLGTVKAIRTGLNSTLMSRELFGVSGAAICPLIITLGTAFYAVFEGSVMAAALQTYFGVGDIRVWYAVVVVGTLPLMLGGMRTWLGLLNGVSMPIYFFGVLAAVLVAGSRFGWDGRWDLFDHPTAAGTGLPGWLTIFVLYMGVWIVLPEIQDSARMAEPKDTKFHASVTFGILFWLVAYLFNAIAGILIVALAYGQPGVEPTEIGAVQGVIASLGVVGLIVIVVSQVRINTANFYYMSISAERFVSHFTTKNLSRRAWVLLGSAVVLIVMFTDIFSYLATALAWMGCLLASWMGIQLVGWWLDRGKDVEFRPERLKNVAPGFYLWVGSTALGILLVETPGHFPTASALAPLITFTVAAAGYIAMRLINATAHAPNRPDRIRDQVADLWNTRIRCHRCKLSYAAIEMDTGADDTIILCLKCQSLGRIAKPVSQPPSTVRK
ncbi:purine-cytosine permease family protein [Nocardioides albus]|uniref:Purine-cytosine permease-like protein n=1 Tax=Nocardioides albus TaxID=1841 RepID=A0A7W5A9R8_9ACTN|nr:hypothetical protein [Nocardioides albus]MBB3092326.1 purine-cytosine permease-like protein [Nocardioides albus]GGU47163.1 allantoin permease [Nocardioides albus]